MPFVTHLLIASRELGTLHHNVRLKPILDVDIAFLFTRFTRTIFTLVTGFLNVGVEQTLMRTTISTQPKVPRTLSAADCRKLIPGPKSRSQSPTKRSRRNSDDEEDDSEWYHKRQKNPEFMIYDASHSTEASEVTTPATTERLNGIWLEKELLRSDPRGEWSKEAAWVYDIRNDDKVMGPGDSLRSFPERTLLL